MKVKITVLTILEIKKLRMIKLNNLLMNCHNPLIKLKKIVRQMIPKLTKNYNIKLIMILKI